MHIPTLKTLFITTLAATAFIAQPATAEAKSKHRHGYHKHYTKHYKYYPRYSRGYRHRGAYYYGPRRHYYYSPRYYSYGPRYYTPYRRSGFSFYLNL